RGDSCFWAKTSVRTGRIVAAILRNPSPTVNHQMTESVLLVGVDVDRLFEYQRALGLTRSVLVSTSFEDARALLLKKLPTLLITEVPLHEYNGLHLVLWCRVRLPRVRCIVVGGSEPS